MRICEFCKFGIGFCKITKKNNGLSQTESNQIGIEVEFFDKNQNKNSTEDWIKNRNIFFQKSNHNSNAHPYLRLCIFSSNIILTHIVITFLIVSCHILNVSSNFFLFIIVSNSFRVRRLQNCWNLLLIGMYNMKKFINYYIETTMWQVKRIWNLTQYDN